MIYLPFVSFACVRATLGVRVDDDEPSCRRDDVWDARVLGFRGRRVGSSRGRSWTTMTTTTWIRFWIEVDETFTSFSITWMHRRVPPSFARTSVVVFDEEDADAPGP